MAAGQGGEKEHELSQVAVDPRPRVVAEPVGVPAQASPARPYMESPAAGRLPSGMGSSIKPSSIFGSDMGPGAQVQSVPLLQPRVSLSGVQVAGASSPKLGQQALDKYPAIEQVLSKEVTGVTLSKAEASAILSSLEEALVRLTAPENAGAACVREMAPGLVEKASALKLKLQAFVAGPDAAFNDFTAAELEGADRVIACAGQLAKVSHAGMGLAWVIFIAGAAYVGYLITNKK